jgi:hypothetical protein
MFDDIKDTFAKISIARLQKRIDTLKTYQQTLDKITPLRTLSELEHYRLHLSIGVASIVLFGVTCLVGTSIAATAMMAHNTSTIEKLLTMLFLFMAMLIPVRMWEASCLKTIKFWQAASPINRAELQHRIDDLELALTQGMAKRFGWSTKPQ